MPDPVVPLTVRVTPRADRSAVTGLRADGVVQVRVASPPVDGAANRAVCAVLAEFLGVRRSAVRVVGGATAREKRLEVLGLTSEQLAARLVGLPRSTD